MSSVCVGGGGRGGWMVGRVDVVIKHVTDIEISCEKNQNLSALGIHQRKDYICLLLIIGFLMMIMILEYGVTS